jgi:hypothetical protein
MKVQVDIVMQSEGVARAKGSCDGMRQEFCALVNDEERSSDRHASTCSVCLDGGDLLCCDGCPSAVHPLCVGLTDIPEVCSRPACASLSRVPIH